MMVATGLLLLRFILGFIFLSHGIQKLFGVLGGRGLQGTTQLMETLGLRPARVWAVAAALGEFVGGLLMVLGLLTPLAALLLTAVMLVAIVRVHAPKGFWNSQGGFEYNLVLFVLAAALALTGAGQFSLDALIGLGAVSPMLFLLGIVVLALLGLLVWLPTVSWVQKRWHSFQA